MLHGGARASLPTTARLVALAEDSEDSAEALLVVARRRGDLLRVREVQLVRWAGVVKTASPDTNNNKLFSDC